jgi:hypothetical protein
VFDIDKATAFKEFGNSGREVVRQSVPSRIEVYLSPQL